MEVTKIKLTTTKQKKHFDLDELDQLDVAALPGTVSSFFSRNITQKPIEMLQN
jgi:hypothetical protein